jgi:uncharacterized membrane protein
MPASIWTTVAGEERLIGISRRRQMFDRFLVGAVGAAADALTRHWLLLINVALAMIVGGALTTPLLYALGWSWLASRLFEAYHLICGQIPSHSYFIFGHQVGLCARNLAIYSSLLGGSIMYRSVRTWSPPLSLPLWLLTLAPMALDGGTQLFGWRESTWALRTLTGVLFGLGVCWLILPQIERLTNAAVTTGGTAASAFPQGALRLASGEPPTMGVRPDGRREVSGPWRGAQRGGRGGRLWGR